MNYADARSLFQDGDVVFFSDGKTNLVRAVIRWFTKGSIYHVGIVVWMDAEEVGGRRLMLTESQPSGYRMINLGFYADRSMTVMRCPISWKSVGSIVIDHAGEVTYNFLDLLRIGLHERWGIPIRRKTGGAGYVCSVIVSRILQLGGVTDIETMVSPQRLHDQLLLSTPVLFRVKGNIS
jgi:hypothetical protein